MRGLPIRHYQGQVLILGIGLLLVLSVALLSMYSMGALLNTKAKQVHALDAAAYSGALIQARALNMQAYINIAQIGHQMAMAHLVTLGSWADWASTQAKSVKAANPPAWVIATHFGAKHGQAYMRASHATVLRGIADPTGPLSQQLSKHDEVVEKVLAKVSYAIQKDMSDARDKAIHAILQQNYPTHQITQSSLVKTFSSDNSTMSQGVLRWWLDHEDFRQFTPLFKPITSYRSLLTDVAALYHFLDSRQAMRKSLFPVSEYCPMWRHELRRQGQTILNDQGKWQSIDTQSYHALRSNKWIGCYYREYPMGWGWVPTQNGKIPENFAYAQHPPANFATEDFWKWVKRATTWNLFGGDDNPLANSRAVQARHRWTGGGLVPYVDINHALRKKAMGFILHLEQREPQGHLIHTQTAAETFFERPSPRKDNYQEMPNLWHPYWQARLVSIQSVKEEE